MSMVVVQIRRVFMFVLDLFIRMRVLTEQWRHVLIGAGRHAGEDGRARFRQHFDAG